MKTTATEMFNIELPIFGFSHCRDVVAAVSRAGGMGVLGGSGFTVKGLEEELRWLDEHTNGRPYGIDLLMASKYDRGIQQQKLDIDKILPDTHVDFLRSALDAAGIPRLPENNGREAVLERIRGINMTPDDAIALLEVAFRHPLVKLYVNALGVAPKDAVEACHARGIKVGAMIGKLEHAKKQIAAGVDFLVAQGTEAGGHTGPITSMILWPQVVDLAGPNIPVLAAGGVGRGRQMAAAMALGAAGVWCGSIWMGTKESDASPELKERLFAARSEDARQTTGMTGAQCRVLASKMTELWEQPDAPKPLVKPAHAYLMIEPRMRVARSHNKEWLSWAIGQVVGDMKAETDVRQVIQGMLEEYAATMERMNGNI
jgi:NAD(P)H-dependent flavin oxidoreductase YrpB (nitropropane dioxygenase family)